MHLAEPTTFYVFGLSWWPFDGAVTAALIALVGTLIGIWFNRRRFKEAQINQTSRFEKAETNQTTRHKEVLESTERLSEHEQLLIDMRRAEEALANDDEYHWVYAGMILKDVHKSPYATDADRHRARVVLRAYWDRVSSTPMTEA